jgi:hypothetical protein
VSCWFQSCSQATAVRCFQQALALGGIDADRCWDACLLLLSPTIGMLFPISTQVAVPYLEVTCEEMGMMAGMQMLPDSPQESGASPASQPLDNLLDTFRRACRHAARICTVVSHARTGHRTLPAWLQLGEQLTR